MFPTHRIIVSTPSHLASSPRSASGVEKESNILTEPNWQFLIYFDNLALRLQICNYEQSWHFDFCFSHPLLILPLSFFWGHLYYTSTLNGSSRESLALRTPSSWDCLRPWLKTCSVWTPQCKVSWSTARTHSSTCWTSAWSSRSTARWRETSSLISSSSRRTRKVPVLHLTKYHHRVPHRIWARLGWGSMHEEQSESSPSSSFWRVPQTEMGESLPSLLHPLALDLHLHLQHHGLFSTAFLSFAEHRSSSFWEL